MRLLCLICIVFITSNQLSSQCVVACNDELQINLNQDGYFVVTPVLLLQGNIANCPNLGVELYDSNNIFIGDTLTCVEAGTTVTGRLVNYDNNVFCDTDLLVFDNISPQFTCPDVFVLCNEPNSPDDIGYPTVTDNCAAFQNSDLFFSDVLFNLPCFETINGQPVTARIERTWLVDDQSGNQGSCVQNIYLMQPNLSDVQFPPHFTGAAALTCSIDDANDFSVTGVPTIGGNEIDPSGLCDISILVDDQVFSTCGGGTTTIRTWLALDVCNNTTLSFDQIIEVRDMIGPNISCPADIIINAKSFSCDADFTVPTISVTDECSDFTVLPSWEFGTGYGPFANVPAGQHELTYTATDACGNTSQCIINVNIVDNTPPTPVCEDGISVSLLPSGLARVFANTFDEGSFDNCGVDRFEVSRDNDPFGSFVEFYCSDIGSQPVVVNFRAYDINGHFNECSVAVTVKDNFRPSITCPGLVTLECNEDITDLTLTGLPIASDACGVDTMFYDDSSNLVCGIGTIQRTWTVVDIHGNSSSCLQTIALEDNSTLDIVFPENTTVDFCLGNADVSQTGSPIINGQGCKNILTNFEDQNFSSTAFCYTILRTWTVINWCEFDPNSGSNAGQFIHTQRIDIVDNTNPVIACPDDTLVYNLTNDCSATFINISIPSVTDCTGDTFIKNNSPFADAPDEDASGFYPNGIHSIEYTAFDNCGNASVCTQVVEVRDGLSPNLICENGLVIEMSANGVVTIDPSLLVASLSDNCTPSSQLNLQLSPNTFTCDDVGFQPVSLTATDLEGNETTCNTIIEVQDNMFSCSPPEVNISGRMLNLLGAPVEGIEVTANGIYFASTDFNGNYTFENLPAGENYMITPLDQTLEINGLSTFDLVLISAHILQTRRITNPYSLIAADVDNSNQISVFDLIGIRQVVLEAVNIYNSGIAWKCVDANFAFTNSLNPFLDDYPLELNFNQLNSDVNNADFVAIKLGDVDANGSNLNGLDVTERNNQKVHLDIEDKMLKGGQIEEVEFTIENHFDLYGLQFELAIDPALAEFVGISFQNEEDINNSNFIYDSLSNSIKFSWNSKSSPIEILNDEAFLKLSVKLKTDCKTKEFIKFEQNRLMPEIYDDNYEQFGLALRITNGVKEPENLIAEISMAQNYPNPVATNTSIKIDSPISTNANLIFVNTDGKIVLEKQLDLTKGENIIKVKADEIQTNSKIIFYTLLVDDVVINSKKMILKK